MLLSFAVAAPPSTATVQAETRRGTREKEEKKDLGDMSISRHDLTRAVITWGSALSSASAASFFLFSI
jgi:hypothetical protein